MSESLRIGGVPEHFNMPWHLAIESGAFTAAGLDVEWVDCASGTGAMLDELAAGRLDVANLLTEGAALALVKGQPITAVSLYTTTPLIWGAHVPPRSRFRVLDDLRGARFGISRYGSGSHLMALALASERGWDPAALDFTVVNDLDGAIVSFAERESEAFLWEHFTTQPAVDAGHFRRIDDFVSPWPAWVVCARERIVGERQPDVDALLRIVALQAARLQTSGDAAATIAERYGLAADGVARWLGQTRWVEEPTDPQPALAAATTLLARAGVIQ